MEGLHCVTFPRKASSVRNSPATTQQIRMNEGELSSHCQPTLCSTGIGVLQQSQTSNYLDHSEQRTLPAPNERTMSSKNTDTSSSSKGGGGSSNSSSSEVKYPTKYEIQKSWGGAKNFIESFGLKRRFACH